MKHLRTQIIRPISLINTIYKAISKSLVNRLQPIFQREASSLQNAFTQDRSIHDNLLIGQEALNTFQKSQNKTSFHLQWKKLTINGISFGNAEHHLVPYLMDFIDFKECVTDVSYSIKLNGLSSP